MLIIKAIPKQYEIQWPFFDKIATFLYSKKKSSLTRISHQGMLVDEAHFNKFLFDTQHLNKRSILVSSASPLVCIRCSHLRNQYSRFVSVKFTFVTIIQTALSLATLPQI